MSGVCERKVCFARRRKADDVAKRLARETNEYIRSYKCPHCRGWHVGHYRPGKRSGDCGNGQQIDSKRCRSKTLLEAVEAAILKS